MNSSRPLARFGSDVLVYGSSVALNAGVRFIILMIAARVLSTGEFGFLDNILIIGIVIASIMTMGCDSAIIRLVFDRKDRTYHGSLLVTAYLISLLIAVSLVSLAAGTKYLLDIEWYQKEQDLPLMLAMTFYSISLTFYSINTSFMRALFLKRQFLIATAANLLMKIAPVIFLTFSGEISLLSLFMALSAGALLASVASLYLLRNYIRNSGPILRNVRPMLIYGMPLGFIVVAAGLQPAIERFQIVKFADLETLGIYAAAAFPSLIIGILIQILNAAWTPYALKKHVERDTDTFGIIFIMSAALVSVIYVCFALLAHPIIQIAVPIGNPAAAGIFPFIGLIIVLRCMSTFTSLGITIAKASRVKFYLYVAGIIMGTIASSLLFPAVGVLAIPLGFFCSNLLAWYIETLVARRLGGPQWPMIHIWMFISAIIVVAIMLSLDRQFVETGVPNDLSILVGVSVVAGMVAMGIAEYRKFAARNTSL